MSKHQPPSLPPIQSSSFINIKSEEKIFSSLHECLQSHIPSKGAKKKGHRPRSLDMRNSISIPSPLVFRKRKFPAPSYMLCNSSIFSLSNNSIDSSPFHDPINPGYPIFPADAMAHHLFHPPPPFLTPFLTPLFPPPSPPSHQSTTLHTPRKTSILPLNRSRTFSLLALSRRSLTLSARPLKPTNCTW